MKNQIEEILWEISEDISEMNSIKQVESYIFNKISQIKKDKKKIIEIEWLKIL